MQKQRLQMLNEKEAEDINELMILTFTFVCDHLEQKKDFQGEIRGYMLNFFASCLSKVIVSEVKEDRYEQVVDWLAEQMKTTLKLNYKIKRDREKQ